MRHPKLTITTVGQEDAPRLVAKEYIIPFILITLLFLLWGGARSMMDVLNKHVQMQMDIGHFQSSLMQAMTYGAYFLGAIPAGLLIRRLGTRRGVIVGLLTFAVGSLSFIPLCSANEFYYILPPLFIVGAGLVVLETAANPYVTLLGDPRTSASRLNLSQSMNGLGCVIGVFLGGQYFFQESDTATTSSSVSIAVPYSIIAVIVIVVAVIFSRIKLPEVSQQRREAGSHKQHQSHTKLGFAFFFGLLALVSYEISEISINTFFVNYMTDDEALSPKDASTLLSIGGLGFFMMGRICGGVIMRYISSETMLLYCALGTIICMILTIIPLDTISYAALVSCYIFESIMFPTIFALALRGQEDNTERASSILMMSVVGGAIGPVTMGAVAELTDITFSFIVPLITFCIVLAYAIYVKLQHAK